MKIAVETRIAAPPETVFQVMTDIPRWQGIVQAIIRIEVLTAGPVAVGTRFRETRKMLGREATEEMTVELLDPPHRFVLGAFNHGTRYRVEHSLVADPQGTRVRLVFEGRPECLAARLLSPLGWLMLGTIRRQLAADLADVRREAERLARR